MFPSVTVFGFTLPCYGICAAAGLILLLGIGCARARRFGITAEDVLYITLFAGLFAAAGAKLLYLLTVLPEFCKDLPAAASQPALFSLLYLRSGFVFYGGLLGAMLGVRVMAGQYKLPPSACYAALVPAFAAGHAVMRVGCFCAGCCYGVESERFGIAFARSSLAPNGVPLLPVQLWEAAGELLIFAFLLWFARSPQRAPHTLRAYLLLYAPLRFVLEFFRGDAVRGFIGALSLSQCISLALLAALLIQYAQEKRRAP